jgi:hypothetical protein
MTGCAPCPAGTTGTDGSCTQCEPGRQSSPAATECERCDLLDSEDLQYYSSGGDSCLPCWANSEPLPDRSDCKCKNGFVADDTNSSRQCIDFDECAAQSKTKFSSGGICDSLAPSSCVGAACGCCNRYSEGCVNLEGSFQCLPCKVGFVGPPGTAGYGTAGCSLPKPKIAGCEVDQCGICDGDGSTCHDCSKTPNGDATHDQCGACNVDPSNHCEQDCQGIWGGGASIDSCGVCEGDHSSCKDCAGVPDGHFVTDRCKACVSVDNRCALDCMGRWGGDATLDDCGICGGDGVCREAVHVTINFPGAAGTCSEAGKNIIAEALSRNSSLAANSCAGVTTIVECTEHDPMSANGTRMITVKFQHLVTTGGVRRLQQHDDMIAGLINGVTAVHGLDGRLSVQASSPKPVSIDCKGIPGGSALIDACSVCGGNSSACADCAGIPNGPATIDRCDTCNTDPATDCSRDCVGVWGGESTSDACNVCNGDSSTCLDCAGIAWGVSQADKCGTCDLEERNDCLRDCGGVWGGADQMDRCNVCGGDGSTCSAEGHPNAEIHIEVAAWTDLSAFMVAARSVADVEASSAVGLLGGANATANSVRISVTLNTDISSIASDSHDTPDTFESIFVAEMALILDVETEKVHIKGITSGSSTVEMVIVMNQPMASISRVKNALQIATIAGHDVIGVSDPVIATVTEVADNIIVGIMAATLRQSVPSALESFDHLIARGQVPGVSSEFDIHANTIMQCPSGFFTDPSVGCARCPAGEEPNSAQLGCRKCTDRVTASQQTWVSAEGGECTLCPAGRFPNDVRSDCMVCPPGQWNSGNGEPCTPCVGMSEPTRDQSAVRPTVFDAIIVVVVVMSPTY